MTAMQGQGQSALRALLVGVQIAEESAEQVYALLEELAELVGNLGITVAYRESVRIRKPRAASLIGSGRMHAIIEAAQQYRSDGIIFDAELSPAQQRNWERASGLWVIDRQEVILDIFARRAQTKEATLQVELARLEYSLPRLKRAWTHLSRQRGGSSTQRGEGERQIELDARIIRDRIARLKRDLNTVAKRRAVQRKQRLKVPTPTAAIVGYTNAGKSSLLNHLTQAEVLVADKRFATLDPTTRRLTLPDGQTVLLTDTVGFLRRLPHRLIDAFKATLEETRTAQFLIHVLDITNPEVEQHRATTLEVLREIGAYDRPILTVYNKIDLLSHSERAHSPIVLPRAGADSCLVSTETGEGISILIEHIQHQLEDRECTLELLIPHNRYELIAQLHRHGRILWQKPQAKGVRLRAHLLKAMAKRFMPFVQRMD